MLISYNEAVPSWAALMIKCQANFSRKYYVHTNKSAANLCRFVSKTI